MVNSKIVALQKFSENYPWQSSLSHERFNFWPYNISKKGDHMNVFLRVQKFLESLEQLPYQKPTTDVKLPPHASVNFTEHFCIFIMLASINCFFFNCFLSFINFFHETVIHKHIVKQIWKRIKLKSNFFLFHKVIRFLFDYPDGNELVA